MSKPSIIIGTDHGGFELKEAIVSHLKGSGYEVEDIGCYSKESVDYPLSRGELQHARRSRGDR